MLTTGLAISFLAFNPANLAERKPAFDPVRAEVSIDGATVEILAFDDRDSMIAAVLLTIDNHIGRDGGLRLDAAFGDGYASAMMVQVVGGDTIAAPERGMLEGSELSRICSGVEQKPGPGEIASWWRTDLDPCDAIERVGLVIMLADSEMAEVRIHDQAHKPSKKQCITKFAFAGAAAARPPYSIICQVQSFA